MPVLFGLVYNGGQALAVACAGLSALMLWEYLRLVLAPGEAYFKALGFALGLGVAAATLGWLQNTALLVPGLTLLAFLAFLVRPEPVQRSVTRLALVALGALYCGGLIPYLSLLRDKGQGLALIALLCTWVADTAAYFVGRAIGRRKLYPSVSPGKTVEGALGGLVGSVVVAFAVARLFGVALGPWHVVWLGAIAGTFGVVGDLCESLLKRSVGAKDSSHLIPGHGGVLDRFDAVMFVAPAFYIYVALFVRN